MERRRIPQNASDLTALLLVEMPKAIKGLRCWRENVGGAYPIQSIAPLKSAIASGNMNLAREICARIRPIHFGGPNGSADICGLMPDGRALGVEVKWGSDRQSEDQKTCQRVFGAAGAVYVVARDVEGCLESLRNALR